MLQLLRLLAQLTVVLLVARVAGWLIRPLGQPRVIGEMIAGIALGPSLFGAVAPGPFAALFPPDGLLPLSLLSQLGVLLFMFVVGLRLDLDLLRSRVRSAVAVSQVSIALPFVLGVVLAMGLHSRLAASGVGLLPFALFVGASMSVTAFPVLARIISERGLAGTTAGSVAIASAAVDDVTAWCILAGVVAVARATGNTMDTAGAARSVGMTLLAAGAYTVGLLTIGRRALSRLGRRRRSPELGISLPFVGLAVGFAMLSAWVTATIGVHAIFGAFLAGVVIPRAPTVTLRGGTGPAGAIADRIEGFVSVGLLPIFFALSGLRTSLSLVSGAALWTITGLILLTAVAGKLGGSAVAARLTGMGWRESLTVGVLMNTRGLMELVILNVGLEIGVITPTVFAMMVLMALATTLMTSPLIGLLRRASNAIPAGTG